MSCFKPTSAEWKYAQALNAVTGAANHSRFTKKHLATSHEIQQQMSCFKPTSAEWKYAQALHSIVKWSLKNSRSWQRCKQTASCLLERRLWLFRHQGWVHAAFKGTHTVECQLQNLERLALQQFAARIIRQTPLVLENAVTGAANHSRFTKKHLATYHETANVILHTNINRVKVCSGSSFYRQMIAREL